MDVIKMDEKKYSLPEMPNHWFDTFNQLAEYLNAPGNLLHEAIALIYETIDIFNKEFVSTFTVCQSGCSHCCHQNVSLTTIEAEYISYCTGIAIDKNSTSVKKPDATCIFLDQENKQCRIYNVRPFNCRSLHAIEDPSFCEKKETQLLYGHARSGYNNVFYKNMYAYIVQQNGTLPSRYLSDFFPKVSS